MCFDIMGEVGVTVSGLTDQTVGEGVCREPIWMCGVTGACGTPGGFAQEAAGKADLELRNETGCRIHRCRGRG